MNPKMKRFKLDGQNFTAEDCIDGVLINPLLTRKFECTSHEKRPAIQQKWWGRPFIETNTIEAMDEWHAERRDNPEDEFGVAQYSEWHLEGRARWLKTFPNGTSYFVRCLNGGASDRTTGWKTSSSLEEALTIAKPRGTFYPWPGGKSTHSFPFYDYPMLKATWTNLGMQFTMENPLSNSE